MTTQLIDDLTYIAFEGIMTRKDKDAIKAITYHCNSLEEFASEIETYLKINNPFYILDINNPASAIYWAALDNINFVELAQKITQYFDFIEVEEELPY